MASLSETLVNAGLEGTNPEAGPATHFIKGAELAMKANSLQQQQQQLEMKKQELQMSKIEKVGNWFETASKMEDGPAKKAFLSSYVPNGIQALGLNDLFHPDSLKMAQSDPLMLTYMKTKVQSDPSYLNSTLLPAAAQPDKWATLMASPEYAQFKGSNFTHEMLQDSVGLLKKEFDTGNKNAEAMARSKVAAAAQGIKSGAMQQGANVKTDEQASNSGKAIDKAAEPLLQPFRNLEKGLSRLHPRDGSKPSWTIINEVAQDASNALSGARLSSDFKLKEIKQESVDQMLGDLAYKTKSDPNQPANDATIKFWDDFMKGLKGDYSQQIARKTKEAGAEADTAFAHNPQAQKVARNKVRRYQTGEAYRSDGLAHINVDGQDYNLKKAKEIANKHPNDPFSKKILEAIKQVEE